VVALDLWAHEAGAVIHEVAEPAQRRQGVGGLTPQLHGLIG